MVNKELRQKTMKICKLGNITSAWMLLSLVMIVSSCRDQNFDIEQFYPMPDPEKNAEYEANWAAKFGRIDKTQDWNSVCRVTAHVELEKYEDPAGNVIKVFSGDPNREDTRLLAQYDATSTSMDISFDVLKSNGYVYVMRERKDGYYSMIVADVAGGKCEANFAGQAETRAVAKANAVDFWSGTVPTSVPSGATVVTGVHNEETNHNNAGGTNIEIQDATLAKTNFWNGGVNVYLTGNVRIDSWYTGQNSRIYVMPGATVSFTNLLDLAQYKTEMIVCEGGKVTFDNGVRLDNGLTLVNYGEIDASSFKMVGHGCAFYNASTGVVNVSGAADIETGDPVWYNLGHFNAENATFTATSQNWINGCYMKVGNLKITPQDNNGPFLNNAYVECENYYQNVSRLTMSANSQLVVNGKATFEYNCYNDRQQGIISLATGNDWAVFKANKIEFVNNAQHGSASFVGNLIVDCNDMPARTTDSGQESGYNWSTFNGAKIAPSGDAYTIPGGDGCNEPYNPVPPVTPTPEAESYIIACEDLGNTDDVDFNDVVFSVSYVAGSGKATVTPLAAGGVLKSYISIGDRSLGEIHSLINGSTGESGKMKMLNTNYGGNNPGAGQPIELDVAKDFTLSNSGSGSNMGGFVIKTEQENSGNGVNSVAIFAPTAGTAPQMILVPGTWQWPTEKVQIYDAYPRFKDWSQEAGANVDWYDHPDEHASIMSLNQSSIVER